MIARAPASVSRTWLRAMSGESPADFAPNVRAAELVDDPEGASGPAGAGTTLGRDGTDRRHDPGQLGHAALQPVVEVLATEALEEGVADGADVGGGEDLLVVPGAQHVELPLLPGDQDEDPPDARPPGQAESDPVHRLAVERVDRLDDDRRARFPGDPFQLALGRRDGVGTEEPGAVADLGDRPSGRAPGFLRLRDGDGADRHRQSDRGAPHPRSPPEPADVSSHCSLSPAPAVSGISEFRIGSQHIRV